MRSGTIPVKTENVRKIWLFGFALMIGLCGSNAFALDLMGPPTAEVEKGEIRGGLEYSFTDMDIELMEGKATVYSDGILLGSGIAPSITITGFQMNTAYATLGYGAFENCEAFLRLGAENVKFGDSLWEESEEFSNDLNFVVGGGVKATFYEDFAWKIGGLFQLNWAKLDGNIDSSRWILPQPHYAEINMTEMQVAMGVTYLWSSRVSIYGGPFVHFISGEFDYEFSRIADTFDSGEFSWEINEGPTYGGYIGSQVKFKENYFLNIEFQHTANADVFGASLMMKY